MARTFPAASFLLPLMLFAISSAVADDFRCPSSGKIVKEGDSQDEVTAKCGRPTSRSLPSMVTTKVNPRKSVSTTVEKWTYDFGSNYFVQVLTFEGTTLKQIEHGDHGTGSSSKSSSSRPNPASGASVLDREGSQDSSTGTSSARGGRFRR